MKSSKLTFERRILKGDKISKIVILENSYIDFLINGITLSEIVGGISNNVGKFGWSYQENELNCLEELRTGISELENGLISIYVCSECGDEGCGAIMFEMIKHDEIIEWKDFVWSDGYLPRGEDEKINIASIYFDEIEYYKSLDKLEMMINERF